MGSAQTLLALSSSHQKALDTFLGQKAHPSILSPPCRGALEGSQTWMEISSRGWGRGAASSSVVHLGPGWLKCSPRLWMCLFRHHYTFEHLVLRGVWGAFGFFLQQCEFLGFLGCLMMRRGRRWEGGTAVADCRLGLPCSWSWQLDCFEMFTTLVCWAVSYQLACSEGWRACCCINVPVRAKGKICRWKQRYYEPRRFHILKPLASACFTPSSRSLCAKFLLHLFHGLSPTFYPCIGCVPINLFHSFVFCSSARIWGVQSSVSRCCFQLYQLLVMIIKWALQGQFPLCKRV